MRELFIYGFYTLFTIVTIFGAIDFYKTFIKKRND